MHLEPTMPNRNSEEISLICNLRMKGNYSVRAVNCVGWLLLRIISFLSSAVSAAKSLQSSPTLCDPRDGSPPGSPVPGILQARTLKWVAISFFNAWSEKWKWSRSVVPDCSDPMDCSLPGSSVHGTLSSTHLYIGGNYISQDPLSFCFWVNSTNQSYSWFQRRKKRVFLPPHSAFCGACSTSSSCTSPVAT